MDTLGRLAEGWLVNSAQLFWKHELHVLVSLGGENEDDFTSDICEDSSCSKMAAGMPVLGVLGAPRERGPDDY